MVYFFSFLLFFCIFSDGNSQSTIIDCNYTEQEAIYNISFPKDVVGMQELVTVQYYSFDKKLHQGQVVVHKDLAKDIKEIFEVIKEAQFPIQSVIPIVRYKWSDVASIKVNNTSAFNYRTIAGTKKMSDHAYGRAIDVNPYLNPWVGKGKSSRSYNPSVEGTLTANCIVVKEFKKRGWKWGGDWKSSKDYQHFSKK
jgi:hypothetical protein